MNPKESKILSVLNKFDLFTPIWCEIFWGEDYFLTRHKYESKGIALLSTFNGTYMFTWRYIYMCVCIYIYIYTQSICIYIYLLIYLFKYSHKIQIFLGLGNSFFWALSSQTEGTIGLQLAVTQTFPADVCHSQTCT